MLRNKIDISYIRLNAQYKISFCNEKDSQANLAEFMGTIAPYEEDLLGSEINKFFNKLIPNNDKEFIKFNEEQGKLYLKNYSKKNLAEESVNKILATDFKSTFYFGKNVENVADTLALGFKNLKKFKIKKKEDFDLILKQGNFQTIDINSIFIDKKNIANDLEKSFTKPMKELNTIFKDMEDESKRKSKLKARGSLNEENEMFSICINKSDKKIININKDYKKTQSINSINYLYGDNLDNETNIINTKESNIKKIQQNYLNSPSSHISTFSPKYSRLTSSPLNKFYLDNTIDEIPGNLSNYSNSNGKRKVCLNSKSFKYPSSNIPEKALLKAKLPIELIILIQKFQNVKCLIFQIKDMDQKRLSANIFLLTNAKWLIPNLNNIKIDFGDDDLQTGLIDALDYRIRLLYNSSWTKTKKLRRKIVFYDLKYKVNFTDLWNLKDVFEKDLDNIKVYNICRMASEEDYVLKIDEENDNDKTESSINKFTLEEKDESYQKEDKNKRTKILKNSDLFTADLSMGRFSEDADEPLYEYENSSIFEDSSTTDQVFKMNEPDYNRTSTIKPILDLSVLDRNSTISKVDLLTQNLIFKNKKKKNEEISTSEIMRLFVKNNETPFIMVIIFSWFLNTFNNLFNISLFFNDSYALELDILLKKYETKILDFHFLLLATKIYNLQEGSFSMNCFDYKSFEILLGIISKNKNLRKLRLNFFTNEANYSELGLFKLCTNLKINIRDIFKEFISSKNYAKDWKQNELDYFILNTKFLNIFINNLKKLFFMIQEKDSKKFNELCFNFDLPQIILNCEQFIIVLIKFLINFLLYISFDSNEVQVFSFVARKLQIDGRKCLMCRRFFEDIYVEEAFSDKNKQNEDNQNNKNIHNINEKQQINSDIIINRHRENTIKKEIKRDSACLYNLYNNKILQKIVLNFQIYYIPYIFNICVINNISGLIEINIGYLDYESFNGLVNSFNKYSDKMISLKKIKIGLNQSIREYNTQIENVLNKFLQIKCNELTEKIIISELIIQTKKDINKFLDLAYYRNNTKKLLIEISNKNNKGSFYQEEENLNAKRKAEYYNLIYVLNTQRFKDLFNTDITYTIQSFFRRSISKIVSFKE